MSVPTVYDIRPEQVAFEEFDRLMMGDPTTARPTDPGTSHAAAVSISDDAKEASERYVLDVLRVIQPATDERIAGYNGGLGGWSPSRLRTARKQLCDKGLITDSGIRAKTSSGRLATEWMIR